MTENLLQKLEEKVVSLISQLEILRKEYNLLKHENSSLKSEKSTSMKKLQGLTSLLDAVETTHQPMMGSSKSEVLQGKSEYV